MELLEVKDALPKGFKLHWYEIQGVLGRGGFGITYLARDTNLDCDVAIKEYFPVEYASREGYTQSLEPTTSENHKVYAWGLERFVIEARTLAKFSHKNIVRVTSVFDHNKTAYMVMDLEAGLSFADVIAAKTRFNEAQLKHMLVGLMDGLNFVHSKGFVHRDIKPANIILRADGEPVLLDFGSARVALKQTTKLTSLVSFGYTPFEQYNASSDQQGPWTDIYALAGTFHSLLLGTKPAEAMARASALMNGQADPQLPLVDCESLGCSHNFLATLDAGLAFRVDDRPQSVGEWKQMLLEGDANPKARKKAVRKAVVNEPTVLFKPASSTSITSLRSRTALQSQTPSRILPIAAVILILFCVGGGVWFWQSGLMGLNKGLMGSNNVPVASVPTAPSSLPSAPQQNSPLSELANTPAPVPAVASQSSEQILLDAEQALLAETQLAEEQLLEEERLAQQRLEEQKRLESEQKRLEAERLAETAKLELERQRLAEDIKQLEEQKRQQQIEAERAAFSLEAKNLVANFIAAFGRKDHKSLFANNVIASDKQEFVKQLMSAYESFSLSHTPLNINYTAQTAQSVISITSIRAANGNIVKPGAAWRDMPVSIKKGPNGALKLYWL